MLTSQRTKAPFTCPCQIGVVLRSQRTTSRFTRLSQIRFVLLIVPLLMAIDCALAVAVVCPDAGEPGTAADVTVTVSAGAGDATWTTGAINGTVADGTMTAPTVPRGLGDATWITAVSTGTPAAVTVSVSGTQVDPTWITCATNFTAVDGTMATQTVIPTAAGIVLRQQRAVFSVPWVCIGGLADDPKKREEAEGFKLGGST